MRISQFLLMAVLLATGFADGRKCAASDALIGTKAQEWEFVDWINSRPLSLESLRGRVVLVRWWTAPACRYCAATAPALNEFYSDYREKGLVVIGAYHHKSETPLDRRTVARAAEKFGFKFPVAIDDNWKTLRHWWLNKEGRDWTSVSFLIDREGMIRHVHTGGQYVKGDSDYAGMKRKIEELLSGK